MRQPACKRIVDSQAPNIRKPADLTAFHNAKNRVWRPGMKWQSYAKQTFLAPENSKLGNYFPPCLSIWVDILKATDDYPYIPALSEERANLDKSIWIKFVIIMQQNHPWC
jgi:hypothetical protein